jgi:hypothetical protein
VPLRTYLAENSEVLISGIQVLVKNETPFGYGLVLRHKGLVVLCGKRSSSWLNSTQRCLYFSKNEMLGGGKSGSANVPTAKPMIPGARSASQNNGVPHSGQKWFLAFRPSGAARTNILLRPLIST